MSKIDDFFTQLRNQSDASVQDQQPVIQAPAAPEKDAETAAIEEKRRQRSQLMNDLALQTTRDRLSRISSPVERKRLESRFTVEQKLQLLEGNTVDKYHGLDGFQRMRIKRSPDGDSGWIVDKDGNTHEFRLSSSSSTYIDAPDLLGSVQRSRYKSRTQPEAVARATGKPVDQLTEFDYANYDHYAQNEFIKKISSKDGYKSEQYDPSKVYSEINADGLEVYARFEGEDSTSSKRKLTTILNPYTGEDIGYLSSLDPNVNTGFSLFKSMRTAGNARRALTAQRLGEFYRDEINPENGYVDDLAAAKRIFEENKTMETPDNFAVGALKQLGGSALSTVGSMAVAINDTLGGSSQLRPGFDLRKYADREAADITVGKTSKRRDEYNTYMQNVSSKFEEGDIAGGLWEFIKHPTQVSMFVAEQLGNMAPGLVATAATGGAGAASFGAATATDLLANIGMDFMEFRKNHGRSMSASEMAKAYLKQLPAAMLDALSDKILVGNTNLLKTARYTPLRAAGEVAKEMGVEGTQEVMQNIASQMNAEDKSFTEAATDPSNISNFMLGALGGGLMSGPVGTGQVARHMVQSAAFQQFKQKYEAKFDQQAADAGDTLASDHRQQRENFITSTLDNYQQAKEANNSTAMFKSITSLNAKLKDTQSGLSAYDKEHIKATLYDVVNDTIASLVKDGAMNPATESVLNKLKDSLGIQDNEQLKKDLAKYAEVYGSASEGRLATQNDTYENDHDRQVKAEQFETLIENLGGTKAEARKLLEEVAEENITSKTEGFDSYLAAAKKASEEGDTHTFEGKVSDMSDRIESMTIKHGKLINGLKDEMNKGAAVDSKGMLSNDKIHIKYGFDKNAAKRGEEVSFDTSFKKEAFNYSTRGGIYRTADQISSEVQYMAEQLNSLEGVSQETKNKVNALVSQVKQNDDLLEHLGYELHRGIKGGAKFDAEQESDVELSKERHAEIKEAMESYFNQYIAPRSSSQSEKLTSKEAYQLKKYTSGLSLSELKSFQKSLDPKKDSIAYEGVSVVIKNRERNIDIASSHDAWLKANRVNGKYNAAAVQETQPQVQSQPKPQAKPQEKPSTARDLKITKSKIDKATDIDELIESGAYIDNLITVVSDPSHKDYKNKPLMRKLKSIKKAIAERIAKLEAQDTSKSLQNGSESTETGQDEQSTVETQEGSQNDSESSEMVSGEEVQSEADNSEELNAEEEILSVIDEYSSEPDKSMSSEEIKAILNDINLAIDYIQKYPDNAAITRHADELQDILNTYQELYDKVLKQEAEESTNEADDNIDDANEEELTFYDEYEDNVDRLKQELINDSSKKEKVDSSAFIDDVYPIGGSVIVNWFKGKLNAFSNRFISKAINVFKAKKPAMDIMGNGSAIPDNWQDLPIADVVWKAVDALKSTLVQYELTPTLAKENGAHYKHLNAIIENVLRKNPHLQLIYKPTAFTGGRNGTTGQNFANIDAVDINPNAAMAIYMAVSEFFANRSVKSMLNPVTRDEIAAAFGTTEDAVDPATLEVYSRISNAWGVFRGPLKNTLGKMVLDNLGIGKGRNLSEELSSTYANAEAAMGDIALVMAEYFGWITINDVYKGEKPVRSDFKEGDKGTKEYQDELDRYNRMAKTSDLGITDEEAQKLGLGSHKVLHFYKYNDTTDTVNSINETWLDSLKQFKTGEDTLTRTPSLDSNNTHVSAGRRKQEKFKLTKKRVQVLKKESEAPYYINMPVMRQMLKACGSIEKFRRNVLERMGYDFRGDNKKLLETLSYDEQQKIKGKNESLARELDYLISYAKLQEALEADGSFKGYFFSYFGSANGRSFIDSNTVNPQTAKTFTRFLMQPKTTEQAYDLGNVEDIQCELFAVAQAFNCLKSFYKSGDNKSHSGVSLAGKLLGLDVIGNYNAVAERLSELKRMQKDLVLNNAKKNKDIYNDTLGWNGDVENFGQACVAIDHCIRRLEAILDNNGIAEGASVTSYLAVENDSTTSGYVIKFLLMPLDRDLLAQYGLKVGFLNQKLLAQNPDLSPEFRERLKEYTSIDELKADPEFLDIYKTAAIEMVNEVNEIKAQAGSTPEALGTYVYNDMCLVKDSDGMPTNKLNKLGKKLENSGLSSKDIGNGVAKADNGIPKPDPEKGVSGVLRNLMKPIVMIFGYNASKNSLVKRFSKAVMDDHIAYFMALINGSGLSISRDSISVNEKGYSIIDKIDKASLNSVISFMEDIAVKVAGTSDRIKAIKVFQHLLRTKSPYGIRFAPKEGFDENSTLSIAEWYELTVGGVYGKAVTNFLDKKFGEYGLANKLINDVSKMAFKIYDTIRTGLIEKELWLLVNNNENVTPEIKARRAAIRSKYKIPDGMPIDYTRLNITDLKVKEVEAIENKLFNLIPSFPMPEGNGHDTNIRSVETASRNLDNSGANTQLWKKGPDGRRIAGQTMRPNGTTMIKGDNLNSFGDLKDFKAGERMLAVLLIHFVDGVVAEHTMDHLLSDNPELNRFLTVVHDAFIVSAKDSKNVGIGFNKALMDVCKNFKVFESLLGALNNLDRAAQKLAVDEELVRRNEALLSKKDIGQIAYLAVKLKDYHRKSEALKNELFTSDSNDSNSKTILANLGGDAGAEYLVSGKVAAPVSNAEMSTPTAEERASIQEGDALGSRAAAWKDGYTIEKIERDANATAEGRDRLVDSLNEYDELEGPVKNTSEFVKHIKSFLSLLNPERLRELSLELAKSKKDTATKGVYFTGQGQSGNRRITVIKAKDIANEADRQRRLASKQVSAVSVYGHEVIHAAVSEPLANAEIYGVTRERSALQKFQNAVADKLHELHGEHPENFFRPDNYDSLTDAEKALADQSALDFYNYMFANPDPDALGGLQEFVAYATTDPRMIELLKSMNASQYSAEYKGKNLFEKLCYIVKHIIKAAFGNLESRQKVINTYTSLGNNPKKAANMHEAIEELLIKLSYANKDAASKLGGGKLSQFEHMFEALNSAAQLVKPVNDYLSNKIKWVFDLGGVANRFERTYKSFEQIIREHGITENSGKMDTLKTLLLCPFSHNMRVALIDTLIGCCEQGQRSTFAHLIRDISDKDDATAKIEALSAKQNLIDQTSRNAGAATSAYIQQQFGGKLTDAEAVAGTKIGLGCDLQCLFFNGYSIADIKKLAAGEGIEEAIAKHEDAIRQFYANDKDGKMKFTWTRNQCLGLAHFMNTNKGNPALCLNAKNIAKGILCSKRNAEVNEDLVNHIDCLATLHALANAEPEHRLALSTMKPEGLKAILQCHRNLIDSTREGEYIEEAHVIKGWHASLIDDTRAYAVAPVDPDTIKAMENDGYALYEDKALPVDNMTDAVMGFYIKDANTPQHRQGAALQITGKRAIGQSLNSFMEANEHIIGDRKDYIRKQTKKAFAFKDRMQAKMESLTDLKYEDFDTRKLIGSYYTPVINPKGDVVDFRITMFNDFKDVAMHRNNNVCDVLSKMEAVNVVKRSAGTHNSKIVHFLVDDMEKNMDPDTHRLKHQYENFGEIALGSRDLRHKHDIKYVKLQLDPESEFVAPDIPAAILPSEMKMAMKKLEQKGDGLWVREDWLYQIFGTPEMSLADFDVMQKENMRAARNGIRVAENVIKGIATLAKVAIVFKKPAVIVGNCVSNYMFHLMNGHNPVTAAAMDTENLQLLTRYMQLQKEVNVLDLKKDIGEATDYEKAKLTRYRAEMENSPVHELVQEGLFSAIVEDNSKKDQDSIKFMIRKIKENPIMQKAIKTKFGDAVNMDTLLGQAAGQIWMREGTPIYDFIYTMTQYSDFVSRLTDYRIGMANMRKNKAIADNPALASRYRELLIQQIRDDYINYDIPQSKLMNYVNAMGITFFTKYFFRIQRVIRRIATRRPLMTFAMFASKAHFDLPDNIFNQSVVSKKYSVIPRGLLENVEEAAKPQLFEIIEHPFDWLNLF